MHGPIGWHIKYEADRGSLNQIKQASKLPPQGPHFFPFLVGLEGITFKMFIRVGLSIN